MREVGAFEAKGKLGQLLDLVEQGEEVTITRHGKPVARLAPVRPMPSREQALAANAFVNGRRRANSAALTAGNGRPTGIKVVRESRARWLGDARLDLR